jgi:gamma-glutamylcyclotransferase (GGCT)/AIG2-like uncharacterized protein YtfP
MSELNTIPVFVYGSLRPGANGASGMMSAAAVAGPWSGVVAAELRYHECGAYPVLVANDNELTRGEMYLVDEYSKAWQWLLNMEIDAGYTPRWIEVVAQQSDGTVGKTDCLTFMWEHDYSMLCPVPNGDWLTADHASWPRRK